MNLALSGLKNVPSNKAINILTGLHVWNKHALLHISFSAAYDI
jgi:hypothetical protein